MGINNSMKRSEYDALLKEYEGQISEAFLKAIEQIKNQVVLQDVINALDNGNINAAMDALKLEPQAFYIYEKAIEGTLFNYGSITIAAIKSPTGRVLQTIFNMRNPRAEAWLAQKSSSLITEILEPTKELVRAELVKGLQAGINPKQVALDIVGRLNPVTKVREGGLLGLTSGQSEFVANAKDDLQNLDKRYFTRAMRDKRYDAMVRKSIDEGKPLSQANQDKIINRYTQKLLKYRGNVIGRTEAMSAMNAAEYESFKQILAETNYSESDVICKWESAKDLRVRDSHSVLNGKKVRGLDTYFTSPLGSRMRFPTDRSLGAKKEDVIQCRCRLIRKIDYFREETNV